MWSTKEASYLFRKRGVFYYSRRVPKDLWGLFRRQRVVFSLRTKARAKALKIASRVSLKLEDQWQGLRWQHCDQVLERFTSSRWLFLHSLLFTLQDRRSPRPPRRI